MIVPGWGRINACLRQLTQLLPCICVVCGRSEGNPNNLCDVCASELPWIQQACNRCGVAASVIPILDNCCGKCRVSPPPFNTCRGLFHYQAPIDKLITGYKFNARFEFGFALSFLLAQRMQLHYQYDERPDLILAVPLHSKRLRERGFNQALEIARVVSRQCMIPLSKAVIARFRETAPQTEIGSRRARALNMKAAFSLKQQRVLENVKYVAVIDDVVTTMATVISLSDVLLRAGVERLDIWCLARASR